MRAQVKLLAAAKAETPEEQAAYDELRSALLEAWPQHLPVHTEALARASSKLKASVRRVREADDPASPPAAAAATPPDVTDPPASDASPAPVAADKAAGAEADSEPDVVKAAQSVLSAADMVRSWPSRGRVHRK